MGARERIKRLRDLIDRLERLPASPERDRVLAEVRGRAVDVDTGETPRAMPKADPIPPAVRLAETRRSDPGRRRPPRPHRVPPTEVADAPPARPAQAAPDAAEPASLPPLLWDDDPWYSPTPEGQTPAVRPWTKGLRG